VKEKDFLRRCWGLTRNFRRCGRQGNWRLFCDDHRLQPFGWLFGLVFTVIAGIASSYLAGWIWHSPTVAPKPIAATFREGPNLRLPPSNMGVTIRFGIIGLSFAQDTVEPIGVGTEVPFRLYKKGNRVFCDVNTYWAGGVVAIKHNEVDSLPAGWDWNSNNVGLEIVNPDKTPMFQMYYVDSDTIEIQGVFAAGDMVFLADPYGLTSTPINGPDLNRLLEGFHLPRLFKYPSAMFPSVPN
jgi:hypothetical protein